LKIKINEKNRERIAIAEKLGKPDQVPIDLSLGSQFNYLHGWLNLDGRRFFLDPSYMLEAEIEFINKFQIEGVLGPCFGLAIEPSYWGEKAAKIIIKKDTSPWSISNLNSLEKLEDFLINYKEPDPYSAGNFPVLSNCYFYMKNILGDYIDAPMGYIGPFDTSASLVGYTNMFTWVKTNPELIHDLLDKVTNFFIKNIIVRNELFKPKNSNLAFYDDFPGFLSREDFLEFEFPYIKKLYDYYCNENSIKTFHCDGPLKHIVDLIPKMGVNVLLSFDPDTDISYFKEKIGDKVCLKGNIHPVKFMNYGKPEDVKKEAKRQLLAAKSNGGYVMCTGGELGDGCPNENIYALIEATEKYGKY
jgi:hypothetical protein